MKVALVLATNLSHSPYVNNYIQILKKEFIEFDIIVWNKHDKKEKNVISSNNLNNEVSVVSKRPCRK